MHGRTSRRILRMSIPAGSRRKRCCTGFEKGAAGVEATDSATEWLAACGGGRTGRLRGTGHASPSTHPHTRVGHI